MNSHSHSNRAPTRKQQEAQQFRSHVNLRNPIHFLAVGLGSGMFKKMPGTMGSIAAIPLWFLFCELRNMDYGALYYWLLMLFFFIIGCYFCEKTSRDTKTHDSSHIVWDEFVGMWIVLFFMPKITIFWILACFVLFRIFDIIKPWPIRWFDQHLEDGIGIMVDDVIAGAFAAICVYLLTLSPLFTSWLNVF